MKQILLIMHHILLSVCFLSIANFSTMPAYCDDLNLQRQIFAITEKMRTNATSMSSMETEYLKLLESFTAPTEKGVIYDALATMHARNVSAYANKTIEYCSKALQCPLDLVSEIRLYTYWGNALELRKPDGGKGESSMTAPEVVRPYLLGLRLVLQNQTTTTNVVTQGVDKYEIPSGAPGYDEVRRHHDIQVNAQKDAEMQNELIMYHSLLVERIATIFAGYEVDETTLKTVTRNSLQNERGVLEILTKYWEISAQRHEKIKRNKHAH